jgi:two-component system response regulator FixJ
LENYPRIYVIDDDGEMRLSLGMLLHSMGFAPSSFSSAGEFLDRLPGLQPGPILLDVRMPRIDGLSLMETLAARDLGWPIIVMTGHGDVPMAVRAMKLGAVEFLEKPFNPVSLAAALDVACSLLERADRTTALSEHARACLACLTKRETEIVEGMVTGLSNKANAHALGLSVRTVEMHRRNAMRKLGLRSVTDLVRLTTAAALPS